MPIPTKGETLFPGSPPTRCECGCGRDLTTAFVDGRLRYCPAWGYFAPSCYASLGVGFGTGRGSQWQRNAAGKFAKVQLVPSAQAAS